MERIEAALNGCGVFIAIGTSGQVYPAAGFVQAVRRQARCVELNLEETEGTALFHEAHHGPATQIVPAFVEQMLGSCG
jgi:NAD-dependent deacetylase